MDTGKKFRDPVHGWVKITSVGVQVIDTAQFQRLRRLLQLGATQYVYPAAEHSRFGHSLGVGHLAHSWGSTLKEKQPELDINREDLTILEIAGLAHDLGHGSYSHAFESEFLPRVGVKGWKHEDMSGMMLDQLIDDAHIDLGPNAAAVQRKIKAVMGAEEGSPPGTPDGLQSGRPDRSWMMDVVANKRNGLDVDKFDYLRRDALFTGHSQGGFESDVLQENMRAMPGRGICYKENMRSQVLALYATRARMHEQVYTHRKIASAESMLVEALVEADGVLQISERVHDPRRFLTLDDGVVDVIAACEPSTPRIRRAQGLLSRLRSRTGWYPFVTELHVPPAALGPHTPWQDVTPEDIVACQSHNSLCMLTPADVCVANLRVDFTNGMSNPLDNVRFYDSASCATPFRLQPSDVHFLPAAFQGRKVRVYLRREVEPGEEQARWKHAVFVAFTNWKAKTYGAHADANRCVTPAKTVTERQQPWEASIP